MKLFRLLQLVAMFMSIWWTAAGFIHLIGETCFLSFLCVLVVFPNSILEFCCCFKTIPWKSHFAENYGDPPDFTNSQNLSYFE